MKTKVRFVLANVADRLFILILPTLEAELKVKTQDIFLIGIQVNFVCDIFFTKEIFSTTGSALKTILTFPTALGDYN
jgi:hypothetical protein